MALCLQHYFFHFSLNLSFHRIIVFKFLLHHLLVFAHRIIFIETIYIHRIDQVRKFSFYNRKQFLKDLGYCRLAVVDNFDFGSADFLLRVLNLVQHLHDDQLGLRVDLLVLQADLHEFFLGGARRLLVRQRRDGPSLNDGVQRFNSLLQLFLPIVKEDCRSQHRYFDLVVPVDAPPRLPVDENVLEEVRNLSLQVQRHVLFHVVAASFDVVDANVV